VELIHHAKISAMYFVIGPSFCGLAAHCSAAALLLVLSSSAVNTASLFNKLTKPTTFLCLDIPSSRTESARLAFYHGRE
jgi:hypothetical protein